MFGKEALVRAVAALHNLPLKEAEARVDEVVIFGPKALRCERCTHALCEFCFLSGVTTCDACNVVDVDEDVVGHFDSEKEMHTTPLADVQSAAGVTEEDMENLLVRVGPKLFRLEDGKWEAYAHTGCSEACQVTIPEGYKDALQAWFERATLKDHHGIRTSVAADGAHYAIRAGAGDALATLFGVESFDIEKDDCDRCLEREKLLSAARDARRASRAALNDDVWSNHEVVKRAVEALGEDAFRFVQLVAQAAAENPAALAKAWQGRSVTAVVDALHLEI